MAQRVRTPHRGRNVLRLPDNSPLWQHFTRGILLCSPITIHEQEEKVNRNFQKKEEIIFYLQKNVARRRWDCPGARSNHVVRFSGQWGLIRVFSLPRAAKMDISIYEGGMAMQCQKLKTYMETGRVMFLPARAIRPNPAQPRKFFQEEALTELADSIRQHGILQPLSVRRVGTGYELIAGERRLRAAQMAGLSEIPCIVMTMDDRESGMAAMVENLQRQDLDFVEEARGISRLMESWSMSQEQVAKLLGKSQSAIANKLRILRHSPQVLQALREAGLTERHARALLKLQTEEEKLAAITVIAQQAMSVARTEKYIQELLTNREKSPQRVNVGAFLNSLSQSLARIQLSGIRAVSERRETEDQIVLTITIPK